ncbi:MULTISPECIES: hypothetical protein [unclassified Oceanispirochaeta]|uniref:hypothetical protein n=1 Tax=unclassified Oceanispirochaeta TaxID=2635722 RepID=UPI000E091834|nr:MULTISPECIES: hypothetical protein [unclassified Oceanispirochaeta]MBF9018748.1 hypothetical protein [Oceanispirochaeta sp. M2]NPD75186.1 hypothetical protein [Oceanispirochaeta sp. M1]RDG28969.1 hypothetical protein DV872_24125 [Oceanispirochaeta sp. M1]
MDKELKLSDRPVWEMSFRFHFIVLLKRMIALPSKMLGFKPACLYLATWLLIEDYIGPWIWLAVLMMVLFGIVGLKVAGSMFSKEKL